MVERKDVVLALLGASAGFAGLVLVFLGMAVTTIQSYDAETPPTVVRGFKILASAIGVAFLAGVATVSLCVWWLAGGQHSELYGWAIGIFVAQLALLAASALWALAVFVWRTGS